MKEQAVVTATMQSVTIDDVLALDWRTQSSGSRVELRNRYDIAKAYIDRWAPMLEAEERKIATLPIDEVNAHSRVAYAQARYKLSRAEKALRAIDRELKRRGVVTSNA